MIGTSECAGGKRWHQETLRNIADLCATRKSCVTGCKGGHPNASFELVRLESLIPIRTSSGAGAAEAVCRFADANLGTQKWSARGGHYNISRRFFAKGGRSSSQEEVNEQLPCIARIRRPHREESAAYSFRAITLPLATITFQKRYEVHEQARTSALR